MTKTSDKFYVYAFLRSTDSLVGPKYSPYYIGKGCGKRAFSNDRSAPLPRDRSFIVFIQENLTEEDAFALEKYCIALYGRVDLGTGILRNLTNGGEGLAGFITPEETKIKISIANKGKTLGRKLSNETRLKIALATRGPNNPRWNQPVSAITRQKMAEAKRGRKQKPRAIRANITARAKYLYEIIDPNGEVYMTDSLSEFARQYNLTVQLLAKTIKGKQRHHKGWKARIAKRLK